MIAGVVGFLLASMLVMSHGPSVGLETAYPVLVALGYVVGFELLHRRAAGTALALLREAPGGGRAGLPRVSPWPLLFLQQLGFWAVLHFGWSRFVQVDLGLADLFLVPALLMIAPWLAVHLSALYHRWRVEEGRNDDAWPLSGFLRFNLRILVIPVLPCLVYSALGRLQGDRDMAYVMAAYPSIEFIVVLAFTAVVVIGSPFLMRLALASRSMPDSPLRRRFEQVAEDGGFRYLDIRVADTHGRVVNALFVGVLGRLRYVFMTDAILEKLSDDDLVGVFAHEMGHSRRGHILFNLALFLGLSLFLQVASSLDPVMSSPFAVLWLYPVFILFIFSPVARDFEREADVFAGEILRDAGPIRRSLESIGALHPRRIKDGGLVHPSIEQRVGFLGHYFDEPERARSFRRRLRSIKLTIITFFAVGLFLWLVRLPTEFRVGGLLAGARRAAVEKDGALAASLLEEYAEELDGGIEDPGWEIHATLWQAMATAALDREDPQAAESWVQKMRERRESYTLPHLIYNTSNISAYLAAATGDWPRFAREWRRSVDELTVLEEYAPDDPEIAREKRDIRFMKGLESMARRLGALPPAARPLPLPEDDTPEASFLRFLAAEIEGRKGEDSLPGLAPGWKRSALRRLKSLAAPEDKP